MKVPPKPLATLCLAMFASTPALAATYEGFVEPYRSVDVATPESGRVVAVAVERGQSVTADQVVVQLDDGVLRAELATAVAEADDETTLRRLELVARTKRERSDRVAALVDAGAASPEERRDAARAAELAEIELEGARLQSERAALRAEEFRRRVDRRGVRPLIAGVVTDVVVKPGQYVSTSEPHLITVVQLDRLRATLFATTDDAAGVSADDVVELNVEGVVAPVRAVVRHVSPVTLADSGRVRIDLTIPNPDRTLRAGRRCSLTIGRPGRIAGPTINLPRGGSRR